MFATSETTHQLCGHNQNKWHGSFAQDDHQAEHLYMAALRERIVMFGRYVHNCIEWPDLDVGKQRQQQP
jgi:hypothetical protein